MKKILIIILISLFFSYFPTNYTLAEISFSNIEVYEMLNGRARLKWYTNEDTRAEIYYGLDQDNLDRFMGYSVYDNWHETVLSGLERDKTYYFKIKAIEESGEVNESASNAFFTNDMEDTIKPEFEEWEFLQVSDNAVVLLWYTNEETKANIYYGQNIDNLNKSTTYKSYKTEHINFIYNLDSNTEYYFKVKAIDRDGNYREKTVHTTTRSDNSHDLVVRNIRFENNSPTQALITWDNNLISKGVIYYGTNPSKLKARVYSDNYYDHNHQVQINDLKADTNYYYKVKSYDSLYGKSKTSNLMSFKTKSLEEVYEKVYPIGTLIKGSDAKVYALREGMEKIWIKNEDTFNKLNYRWNMIKNVSDEYLSMYKTTIDLDSATRHPTGTLIKYENSPTVYMMYYGKKRPFYTARALERRGYSWDDIIILPDGKTYKTGDEVF